VIINAALPFMTAVWNNAKGIIKEGER